MRKRNVLDWSDAYRLVDEARHYAGSVLDADLEQEVLERKPKACYSDDLNTWLPDNSVLEYFAERLQRHYTHVKGFHGCRPLDVRTYYERGLLCQDFATIERIFRTVYSDVLDAHIGSALRSMNRRAEMERGRLFVDFRANLTPLS